MAGLVTATVFVPFAASLQTETAAKMVRPGSMLGLENAYISQTGQISSRLGGTVLATAATQTSTGTSLPASWTLANLGGNLVNITQAAVANAGNVYSFSSTLGKWVAPPGNKGSLVPVQVAQTELYRGPGTNSDNTCPSTCLVGTYIITTWESSAGSGSVQLQVRDYASFNQVVYSATVSGGTRPRVVPTSTGFVWVFLATTTLTTYYYACNPFTGAASNNTTTTGAFSDSIIDVATDAAQATVYVLYQGSGGVLLIQQYGNTGAITTASYQLKYSASTIVALSASLVKDYGGSGRISVAAATAASGLLVYWSFGAPSAGVSNASTAYTIDSSASAKAKAGTALGIYNVSCWTTGNSGTGEFQVLYDLGYTSNVVNQYYHSQYLNAVYYGHRIAGVLAGGNFAFGGTLASEGYYYATSGFSYVLLTTTNLASFQQTHYLMQLGSTSPLCKVSVQSSGGIPARNTIPTILSALENNIPHFVVPAMVAGQISVSELGGVKSEAYDIGLKLYDFRMAQAPETQLGRPLLSDDVLFVPGGDLKAYDGLNTYSATLPYAPEAPVLTQTTGGFLTASGTYYYCCTFALVDNTGRIQRSAPSLVTSGTLTGSNDAFTVQTWPMLFTANPNVVIEIWRTVNGATQVFQKVGVVGNVISNTAVSFTDTIDDGDLAFNEFLYTTGGILQSDITPGFSSVELYDSRIWGTSMDDTQLLWFSDPLQPTKAPKFSTVFQLDLNDDNGPITGLGRSLDGHLLVFKHAAIYLVQGTGPDETGAGSTYAATLIASGVGTDNPRSICVSEEGTWFMSSSARSGMHVVDRGLTVNYVGQGVFEYNPNTIVAAVPVPEASQVRFYTYEGEVLVWNTVPGAWSTYSNQAANSAVNLSGSVVYVCSANNASPGNFVQDSATYNDGASAYNLTVTSPWLRAEDVGGWERVRKVQGVGSVVGAHNLTVYLYGNDDDSNLIDTFVKGFDGSTTSWDWQVKPSTRKLSSLKVKLVISQYVPPASTYVVPVGVTDSLLASTGHWTFSGATFNPAWAGDDPYMVVSGAVNAGNNGSFPLISIIPPTIVVTPTTGLVNETFSSGNVTAVVHYQLSASAQTAGAIINGVNLIIGAKPGTKRLPDSARIAPS